uniref:Sushi domain-containing protein n=1 Tax=Capitella teleta TaxID=283909 RepID=X2BCX6_CAPTE
MSTRVCQSNGRWAESLPTCEIKTCRDPGVPAHGSVLGSSFQFRKSLVFSCQTGYKLCGQSTLTCGANSRWNYPRPTCQIVLCPVPQTPPNGAVSSQGRSYQSVIYFSCKLGYAIQGNSRRTCQVNTQWSGSQPTCNREWRNNWSMSFYIIMLPPQKLNVEH